MIAILYFLCLQVRCSFFFFHLFGFFFRIMITRLIVQNANKVKYLFYYSLSLRCLNLVLFFSFPLFLGSLLVISFHSIYLRSPQISILIHFQLLFSIFFPFNNFDTQIPAFVILFVNIHLLWIVVPGDVFFYYVFFFFAKFSSLGLIFFFKYWISYCDFIKFI